MKTDKTFQKPIFLREFRVWLCLGLGVLGLCVGVVTSCLVSNADLTCRPCGPKGLCGAAFKCVEQVCRPRTASPEEFAVCPLDAGSVGGGGGKE